MGPPLEDANGQFEINWHYRDCLTTADQHVFFKALEDLGSVQIGEDDATPVMPDDILCVPYDTIEGFLHGDKQGEGGAAAARGILL